MDRWKMYLTRLSQHENMIKAAAVVVILLAAVVFFGSFGEKSDNSIEVQDPGQQTEAADSQQTQSGAAEAPSMGPVYVLSLIHISAYPSAGSHLFPRADRTAETAAKAET